VPGEIDTRTTGFGGSAGIIEIFYHFVVRDGDDSFTFAWVNSAGPVKEGIGTGTLGLITLEQYLDPENNGPQIALAGEIGKGLFSIMDSLPRTDVLLGSIVSLGQQTISSAASRRARGPNSASRSTRTISSCRRCSISRPSAGPSRTTRSAGSGRCAAPVATRERLAASLPEPFERMIDLVPVERDKLSA